MAFAGPFAHPPRSTHEILQPNAYIENEKLKAVEIPDVRALLDGKYDVYDSGSIGELDMRALLKQYGERKVADDLASSWRGGAYLAFRRSNTKGAEFATTADLAFLYISRWKSPASAERFSHIYTTALSHRYENTSPLANQPCAEARCPVPRYKLPPKKVPSSSSCGQTARLSSPRVSICRLRSNCWLRPAMAQPNRARSPGRKTSSA
jgi:hypothetical protein